MSKSYLGDGVYVEVESGMLKLTTENGIRATNTIFLEAEVYKALTDYVEHKYWCLRDGALCLPDSPNGRALSR